MTFGFVCFSEAAVDAKRLKNVQHKQDREGRPRQQKIASSKTNLFTKMNMPKTTADMKQLAKDDGHADRQTSQRFTADDT